MRTCAQYRVISRSAAARSERKLTEGSSRGMRSARGRVLSFIVMWGAAASLAVWCDWLLVACLQHSRCERLGRTTLPNGRMLKMCPRHSVYDGAPELSRCCFLGGTALFMVNLLPRESAISKCKFYIFVNEILCVVFCSHSCVRLWRAESDVKGITGICCLVVNKSMGAKCCVIWTVARCACLATYTLVSRLVRAAKRQ